MTAIFIKDPNANLDYMWDWTAWLPSGDTVSTHTVTVAAGDVVLGTHSNTTTTVTAWFSAGTADTDAQVTARVTTAQGRVDDRTITLQGTATLMVILTTLVTLLGIWGTCLTLISVKQIREIDELRADRDADQARLKVLGRLVHDIREENLPAINRRPRTGWWEALQADADAHNGV